MADEKSTFDASKQPEGCPCVGQQCECDIRVVYTDSICSDGVVRNPSKTWVFQTFILDEGMFNLVKYLKKNKPSITGEELHYALKTYVELHSSYEDGEVPG